APALTALAVAFTPSPLTACSENRRPRPPPDYPHTIARTPGTAPSPRSPPYQGPKTARHNVATVSPLSGLENRSLRRRHGVPHIRARKPVATTSPRCPPYQGSKTGR